MRCNRKQYPVDLITDSNDNTNAQVGSERLDQNDQRRDRGESTGKGIEKKITSGELRLTITCHRHLIISGGSQAVSQHEREDRSSHRLNRV